jgi:hypothetical protein
LFSQSKITTSVERGGVERRERIRTQEKIPEKTSNEEVSNKRNIEEVVP